MKLSTGLLLAIPFACSFPAMAFDPALFIGETRESGKNVAEYQFTAIPGVPSWLQNQFRGIARIDTDPANAWSIPLQAGVLNLSPAPAIPGKGMNAPSALWRIGAGVSHSEELSGGKRAGGQLTVSSPSDRPFSGIRQTAIDLTGFYKVPDGARNAWWFFLNFSTDRTILNYIPLPGVAYSILTEDHKLFALIGLPFLAVIWNPDADWRLQLFGAAIAGGSAEISRRIADTHADQVRIYAGYAISEQNYLLAERSSFRDHLYFEEMRLSLGVRGPISDTFLGDVAAGYVFHRYMFEGSGITDHSNGLLPLDAGLALTAKLTALF